ncbi:MAG TPA: hypothetical protein VF135_01290 [Terriglobales bacterium]
MKKVPVFFCIAFFAAAALLAADSFVYGPEWVMFPLLFDQPRHGAYGSQWVTDVSLRNTGDTPVSIYPVDCGIIECPTIFLQPHTSVRNPSYLWYQDEGAARSPGTFLYFSGPADQITASLHIRDIAGSGENQLNVELPVLRPAGRPQAVELLDVPVESGNRITLRIYDLSGRQGGIDGLVSVYAGIGSDLLTSFAVHTSGAWNVGYPLVPGYVQVDDLAAKLPPAAQGMSVRIAVTGDEHFWAFASVTDNNTQRVTIFSPQ